MAYISNINATQERGIKANLVFESTKNKEMLQLSLKIT